MFEHLPEGTNVFKVGFKNRIRNIEQLIERLEKENKENDDGSLQRHTERA
jgi:fructose-specific phosphotransferase system component IIB